MTEGSSHFHDGGDGSAVASEFDEVSLNLVVSDLYAEYHSCGSHEIALNVKTIASNAIALRDHLNKINFAFEENL